MNYMNHLDCCIAFARAYELRSFSAAARELGVAQPTISKRIAMLEAFFGTQLFTRTTRSLQATLDGDRIYDDARRMIDALEAARAGAGGKGAEPSGLLRITAPTSFARAELLPRLTKYLARYPRVTFDFLLTERILDLVTQGLEVGIRIGDLPASTSIARRIGSTRRHVLASASYLHRKGAPRTPEDLVDHDCIVYSGFAAPNRWTFDSESGVRTVQVGGTLKVDDADAMADGVRYGMGIAILPSWLLRMEVRDGSVTQILAEFEPPSMPINVVYADTRWLSLRARTYIDFLVAELANAL
jgi:DNA-binding transcriptional LysR family regulator